MSCVVETLTVGLLMAERAGVAVRRERERCTALHHSMQRRSHLDVPTKIFDEVCATRLASLDVPMPEFFREAECHCPSAADLGDRPCP